MKSKYLFVVAHSDDELLGAGATIQKLIENGHEVSVCCMTHDAITREGTIKDTMKRTHDILGVKNTFVGKCEAMEFSQVEHYELVRFIENAIIDSDCDIVVTHSDNDLHNDHVLTNMLTMEAIRLPQRQNISRKPILEVLTMEIPCSSSWGRKPFVPNTFIDITEEQIEKKIDLINMYEHVIRDNPHPRSIETIKAIATYRGSQCGFSFAEAFRTVFRLGIGGI